MAYEDLVARAGALGINVADLLVLDRNNDPFYCGSPGQRVAARWFAEWYDRLGIQPGKHVRAVHYRLVVVDPPPVMPNGQTYQNTKYCSKWLDSASKWARILGYVDAERFGDKRTPTPFLYMRRPDEGEYEEIGFATDEDQDPQEWRVRLPSEDLTSWLENTAVSLLPTGYDYRTFLQPYLLELIVEKDTVTDELLAACRRYSANLVIGKGDGSMTMVLDALKRIAEIGKPTRAFYLSDYDPKGQDMPTAVARKFEFWRERFAPDADIKLHPLGLTLAQIERYGLPHKPLEEKHLGTAHANRSDFYTELDAFEAHPGLLRRIVGEEFGRYRDPLLPEKVTEAEQEAQERIDAAVAQADPDLEPDLEELRGELRAVLEPYERRIAELNAAKREEMAPLLERLGAVRQRAQDVIEGLDPVLPEPETEADLDWGWEDLLYDSDRDEDEQLDAYRDYRTSL